MKYILIIVVLFFCACNEHEVKPDVNIEEVQMYVPAEDPGNEDPPD